MEKQKVEQEQVASDTTQQQALKEADAIVAACNSVAREQTEISQQLSESQKAKGEHREAYERALNEGDESAMKKALAGIRQVSGDTELLQMRLRALPQKIDRLRNRLAALCDKVRDLRPQAQAVLDQARRDFEQVDKLVARCNQGVQGEINRIADAVQSSL